MRKVCPLKPRRHRRRRRPTLHSATALATGRLGCFNLILRLSTGLTCPIRPVLPVKFVTRPVLNFGKSRSHTVPLSAIPNALLRRGATLSCVRNVLPEMRCYITALITLVEFEVGSTKPEK